METLSECETPLTGGCLYKNHTYTQQRRLTNRSRC